LLSQYGLKPDLTSGQSLLFTCLNWGLAGDSQRFIDTLRFILLYPDQTGELDLIFRQITNGEVLQCYVETRLDVVEWLWTHAALLYDGADLVCLRAVLAQKLLENHSRSYKFLSDDTNRLLAKLMDNEMTNEYLCGTYSLLGGFYWTKFSIDSASMGAQYLNLLSELGLDAEQCISNEMERGWGQDRSEPDRPTRKIIFERSEARICGLRWERDYDPQEPGYDVVSEFNALAADSGGSKNYSTWPFVDFVWSTWSWSDYYICPDCLGKKDIRFGRYMRTKARKERARTGQKQPRSRMPGAWNW
jgi:hypothetical protein